VDYIIELLTESDGGHAVGEGNIKDAIVEIKAMLEENAALKLQISLLKTEVAKWKRAHYFANLDRARIERQEIERIKEIENEQDQ